MISQDDTFSFRKEKAIKSHFYANAHELGRMSSEIRSLIRNRCTSRDSLEFKPSSSDNINRAQNWLRSDSWQCSERKLQADSMVQIEEGNFEI
jgi:hypothetical protein